MGQEIDKRHTTTKRKHQEWTTLAPDLTARNGTGRIQIIWQTLSSYQSSHPQHVYDQHWVIINRWNRWGNMGALTKIDGMDCKTTLKLCAECGVEANCSSYNHDYRSENWNPFSPPEVTSQRANLLPHNKQWWHSDCYDLKRVQYWSFLHLKFPNWLVSAQLSNVTFQHFSIY